MTRVWEFPNQQDTIVYTYIQNQYDLKYLVDVQEEKKSRAIFMAAVERSISKESVVIADALNYIKGYRYQLYCLARSAATPHCVLYCVGSEEMAASWNASRPTTDQYPPSLHADLTSRFEEPNNATKWDSPLFSVGQDEEQMPLAEMAAVLLKAQVVRPPSMATTPVRSLPGQEYISHLNSITNETVSAIQAQMNAVGPSRIAIVDGQSTLLLELKRPVNFGELQRLRRQFVHMNRLHPIDLSSIKRSFIEYLKSCNTD